MADNGTSASFSSPALLCDEDESCLIDDDQNVSVGGSVQDHQLPVEETETTSEDEEEEVEDEITEDEEEFLRNLVQKETSAVGSSISSASSSSSSKAAAAVSPVSESWSRNTTRLDSVNWMINTAKSFKFGYQTPYLSLTYYDHFLSIRTIDGEDRVGARLLSIACLSLATKMIGHPETPKLSEYPIGLEQDYVISTKVRMQTELLVLTTLDWNMCFITPFPYIHYFIHKFWNQPSIKPRVIECIMALIKEITLLEYRPSIIAAAAVLVAKSCPLARESTEFKIHSSSSISLWGPDPPNDQLISCCNLMQQIDQKRSSVTPQSVLSSSDHTATGSVLHRTETSDSVAKRKLAFPHDSLPDHKHCRRS